MSAVILSGLEISNDIRNKLKKKVESMKQNGLHPGLAVILVGNDPASRIYVNNKKKACEEIGIRSFEYVLHEETSEEDLIQLWKH